MKKIILFSLSFFCFVLTSKAQLKKDGTPDMRYKANKETYGNSYSTQPSYSTQNSYSTPVYSEPKTERNYQNGGEIKLQDGYFKSNGTYVEPYLKTSADNNTWNNLGSY